MACRTDDQDKEQHHHNQGNELNHAVCKESKKPAANPRDGEAQLHLLWSFNVNLVGKAGSIYRHDLEPLD